MILFTQKKKLLKQILNEDDGCYADSFNPDSYREDILFFLGDLEEGNEMMDFLKQSKLRNDVDDRGNKLTGRIVMLDN